MIKASAAELFLTGFDVLGALEEFTAGKAEELAVETEEGALTVRLKVPVDHLPVAVPVALRFTVRRVHSTQVELGVQWSNLSLVPGAWKELALRKAMEALPGRYEEGVWVLDLAEVLDHLPVTFQITGVDLTVEGLRIHLSDVGIFPVQVEGLTAPSEVVPEPSAEEADLPEHQSFYAKLRERVQSFTAAKAPKWARPLLPWVLAVPDFFVLLVRLARDERVPASAKLLAGAAVAYLISPVDLIPDAIPVIGEIDDVAVAIFALEQIARRVPAEVVQDSWPGDGEVLELVRSGMAVMNKALPAKMLVAIRNLISQAST